ncbi:DgyrCDS3875 [Dimorphilus gyrociliatus]|uniref:DgyrCDS3875 n=1 Tax=Dimorphilus gyrociliatus TaxID=2664684 RepID=A0A7I8VHU3_9ANNE|nr:DgyrCDS3875 [Dimorphilus gyrociliatus]
MSLTDLNELDEKGYTSLISAVVAYLKNQKTEPLTATVSSISSEFGVPLKKLKLCTKHIVTILSETHEETAILTSLTEQGLNDDQAKTILKKLNASEDNAKEPLMLNKLVNIDWKFGTYISVTASSSQCEKFGSAFFQMKLSIENDGAVKHVPVEMNVSQFYNLLHELEKAKSCVESVSKT